MLLQKIRDGGECFIYIFCADGKGVVKWGKEEVAHHFFSANNNGEEPGQTPVIEQREQ